MKFLILSFIYIFIRLAVSESSCNPIQSDDCDPDPALGKAFLETFTAKSKYFLEIESNGVSYSEDGVKMTVTKKGDNPSLKSNFYIMFGRVEVTLQASSGEGLISSFYLQSDDLDEIDIELFGGNGYQFSSNYFSQGDTSTYNRGEYHSTGTNPVENYHTYIVDWTEDAVIWGLDGKVVRVLLPDSEEGYPQAPMYIQMGLWAGGDSSNAEGTIQWAGGLTDYSKGPFNMYIKSLVVTDYSTGDEYSYTDKSGEWKSIKSKNGKVNGRYKQGKEEFLSLQESCHSSTSTPTNTRTYTTSTTSKTTFTITTTATDAAGILVTAVTTSVGFNYATDTLRSSSTKSFDNGLWTPDSLTTYSQLDSHEKPSFSNIDYTQNTGIYGYHFTSHHGGSSNSAYDYSTHNLALKNAASFLSMLAVLSNLMF